MDITATPPPGVAVRSTATPAWRSRPPPGGDREILSRQRLIRYLVRADLKKKGADTLLGNVWWVIDPLLQMLVYVVLVDGHLARSDRSRTTRSSSSARSCPGSGSRRASTTRSARSSGQERLIKQLQFPKLVLPTATTIGRRRELRLRVHPAHGPDAGLLLGPPDAGTSCSCRSSPSSSSYSRWRSPTSSRPSTSSSATSATSAATCCGCGSTCRRACIRPPSSRR